MSSPNTNLDKQTRRHSGPLIGMAVAVAVVVVLGVVFLFSGAEEASPPQGADVQIDGRTGEPTAADVDEAPAPIPADPVPAQPQPPD